MHSTLRGVAVVQKDIGLKVGAQIGSLMPVRSGSWPRFWPPACPNYTNCTPRPPLSEREEELRDVGLAPQPQRKMGTDDRMESVRLRAEATRLKL